MSHTHVRVYRLAVALSSTTILLGCGPKRQVYRLGLTGASQGLSRITSDREQEFGPVIAADGRSLLFDTRYSKDSKVIGVDPASGARRTVYTMSSSRAEQAAWDPNGTYFVYTSNSPGTWSLVRSVSNSPSAAVSIILSGDVAPLISDPDISPDGQRVAFGTRIRGAWNVGMANLDGSGVTLMGEGSDPVWSPDGKRLAFVRAVGQRVQIFTLDAATGTNVVQVTSGDSDNSDPAWSPDGRYVVFTTNRTRDKAPRSYNAIKREKEGRWNLFAIRADGTGLIQMTDGDAMTIQPAWGHDGWIYFSSNQAGNFDIWRLRPSGELAIGTP